MNSKKKRREKSKHLQELIVRTIDLIICSSKRRGEESERFILRPSEALREKGVIISHCRTSKGLDKRGIDRVYQTRNGFYLVNIKSSWAGAKHHQFWQFLKQDLLIYSLVRNPGESSESIENKLSEIFRQKPSFVHLPDWIAEKLNIKKTVRQNPSSTERVFALTDANARKMFENISGVSWVRAVPPRKTSLTERHIEVVCWTKRGIYLFDIHRDKIIEEGGLKIFPLNLFWPKSKIEEILREEPQETFPAAVYGAIMDLE